MAEEETREEVKGPVKEKKGRKAVPKWKLEKIKEVQALLTSKPVVGIVDLEHMPSPQFQEIKKKMRGKADIYVTRKLIIEKALNNTKNEKLLELKKYIKGPVGLILSDLDAFSLYNQLKKARTKAAAKAGMTAPFDIIIPEGETDLPAGPVLSDLKQAGIDVRLDKGKIVIRSDSTVVEEGKPITQIVAGALSKLGIKPMKVGIKVNALFEKDTIYTPDVLDIDEEKFMQQLYGACTSALNLSVEIGYITPQSVEVLISKAVQNARNLMFEANIITKDSIEFMISKASSQASALGVNIKETPKEEQKEEKPAEEQVKEEPKQEEKTEEKKE